MKIYDMPVVPQEVIKTILSDSLFMDILCDGGRMNEENGSFFVTLSEVIHPPADGYQVCKVLQGDKVCIVQIGGSSTARIVATICMHASQVQEFMEGLLAATDRVIFNIERKIDCEGDAWIKSQAVIPVGLMNVYFYDVANFLVPSWVADGRVSAKPETLQ
jgi:hypothetical protein